MSGSEAESLEVSAGSLSGQIRFDDERENILKFVKVIAPNASQYDSTTLFLQYTHMEMEFLIFESSNIMRMMRGIQNWSYLTGMTNLCPRGAGFHRL